MGWGDMMYGGYGYGPGTWGAGMWWAGLIGMLLQFLFWAAIIAVGFYLVKRYNTRLIVRNGSPWNDNPLQILRERYARGEIDAEEYRRRKEDLKE